MAEPNPILSIFQKIAAGKNEINLINVYKGVPILYQASIVEVGPAGLRVKTERYQVVCLFHEKETFIQNNLLPDIVHARVRSLDIPRLEAVLTDFSPVPNRIGDRLMVRVAPKEPITGDVRAPRWEDSFKGELADISQNGIGIYLPRQAAHIRDLEKGSKIFLEFQIPGVYTLGERKSLITPSEPVNPIERFDRDQLRNLPGPSRSSSSQEERTVRRTLRDPELSIQGIVVNLRDEPAYERYRVGLRTIPDDQARVVLSQFIAQRQGQIIQEIRDVFDLLAKEKE